MPPKPLSLNTLDQVVGGAASPYGTGAGADGNPDAGFSELLAGVQEQSAWLQEANAVLGQLQHDRPAGDGQVVSYGTVTVNGTEVRVEDWMTANGIAMDNNGDNAGFKNEFETAISNLQGSIDTVAGQSQLDMARLQGLMAARNQSLDLLNTTLSETGKNMDQVIGNMR